MKNLILVLSQVSDIQIDVEQELLNNTKSGYSISKELSDNPGTFHIIFEKNILITNKVWIESIGYIGNDFSIKGAINSPTQFEVQVLDSKGNSSENILSNSFIKLSIF